MNSATTIIAASLMLAAAVEGCGPWASGAPRTALSNGNRQWHQNRRCTWCGVRASTPMCANGRGTYSWTVRIDSGTNHQVGIAQSNWNHQQTSTSRSSDRFATAYSHNSGWNRHRGAANHVTGEWSGNWQRTNKGRDMRMSLSCEQRRFTLSMTGFNAVFSYPRSWTTVYAAAAGQSNDHRYTITDRVCVMTSEPTTSPTSSPTPAPTTSNPTASPSYDVGAVVADVSRLQSSLDGEISTLQSRLTAVADGAVSDISLVRPTSNETVDADAPDPQITTADGYVVIEPSPGKGLTLGTFTDVEHALHVAMERIDRLEQLLAAVLTE